MTSQEITAHLDAVAKASGIKGLQIIATGYYERQPHENPFIVYCRDHGNESADTLELALDIFRSKMKTPSRIAAEKREAAQKLITEAEQLEQQPTNENA